MRHSKPIQGGERAGNWMIGGVGSFPREVINPKADWSDHLATFKLQRCKDGDPFTCLTCSMWYCLDALSHLRYGEFLNRSWRFSAVANGTVAGQGNNCDPVDESMRKQWSVAEDLLPFTPLETTIAEFFAKFDDTFFDVAAKDLAGYDVNHAWIPRAYPGAYYSTLEQVVAAAKVGTVRMIVDGEYHYDAQGRIIYGVGVAGSVGYDGPFVQYDHAVMFVKHIPGVGVVVLDTETNNHEIFCENYCFGFSKVYSLKKKNMPQLFKKNDTPGHLYPAVFMVWQDPFGKNWLVPFGAGVKEGGEVFKAAYSTGNYKDLPIQHVDKLPYPIADWQLTSIALDPNSVQGYYP